MDIYDVVKKLVGHIHPVGETNEDGIRFSNLMVMTDLVDRLLTDIDRVGMQKNRQEYSIQKAGKFASDFLTQIGIVE